MEISFIFYALIAGIITGTLIYKALITAVVWRQDPKYFFTMWLRKMKGLPGIIKRRVWNKHLLLWWYRLWIRKDEFHISLSTDREAMLEMNKKELKEYFKDIDKRRRMAHQRDFSGAH